MYYYEEYHIKMARMDGTDIKNFVTWDMNVHELTIDYPSNRLYWLSKRGTIKSIKLDGKDERVSV